MTYPENRTPISWDDVQGVKHQNYSTWEAEARALRELNTELALQALASDGQAAEAHEARLIAEAETKALRARVATLENFRSRVAQVGLLCDGEEAHRIMPHLWPLVKEAVAALQEGGE